MEYDRNFEIVPLKDPGDLATGSIFYGKDMDGFPIEPGYTVEDINGESMLVKGSKGNWNLEQFNNIAASGLLLMRRDTKSK